MFALTSRLTLRPAWPEEAEAVSVLLRHCHADAAGDPIRTARVLCVIASRDTASPRLLGVIWIAGAEPALSVVIVPEARYRGYASEAMRAMLDMARWSLGLRRLVVRIAPETAARRLLARIGFGEAVATDGTDHAIAFDDRPVRPPLAVAA